MINLSRSLNKISGVAILIMSVILIVIITMIVLFAGQFSFFQEKMTSNQYRNNQAFEAAEAGLEVAIPYLQINSTAILANPVNGFLAPYSNTSTTNVALANGTKYSFVYTNPTANNYQLIKITATGVSDDNTTTRIISQLVQFGSLLLNPPTSSLVSQGNVSMIGNANVINRLTSRTIQSGLAVSIGGAAQTTIATGTGSTPGNIGPDVVQNDSSLSGMSPSDFFVKFFGINSSTFKSLVGNYYSNSSDTNYSSLLNGKVGTTIWIDQTGGSATLSGNITIGSPTQPVILIVNGDLRLSGTGVGTKIYGFIYQMGGTTNTDFLGTVDIVGGFATTGNLNMAGNTTITHDNTVLTTIQQNLGYYAKVPGTWKDF